VLRHGTAQSCRDVARKALAQRHAAHSQVHCRIPPGQRGAPGAICLDASGTDLGGFLVAEGFALADPAQSYDYVGAEGVARSFHRGLWHYR
jgi:endonuclease YncB( thermonuclease family)